MRPLSWGVLGKSCFLVLLMIALSATYVAAQLETGTVSGQILDPSGANIVGAQVKLIDIDRGTNIASTTNNSGLYTFPSVRPGRYRMEVEATGFKVVNATGLTVNVQDHLEQNFKLAVGSVSESVTVEGGASQVNTESAAVSTVVDRQFAENLPMNGRSFQTLIQLTPGVVVTPTTNADGGQFSINGQRTSSNYWMVDGVSANIGVSSNAIAGNGVGGSLGSFSAMGGTNSLVSVDAMQEFRIQTSTYAPEFGRTPGGQISIVTRSGTNQFHGTAFDYFRNDALDANDWFAAREGFPKAQERQNDFGGTFGGPILKNDTFFFFSYEGLRLRLPQTRVTTVPDASFTPGGTTNSRQNPNFPELQPYLNAFPLPNANSPEIFAACDPVTDPSCPPTGQKATGSAAFNASYSNPATLNAYSLRIDHKFNDRFNLFGRYNYSPSALTQRGPFGEALSALEFSKINTQTLTVGSLRARSSSIANDLRFNYSRTRASGNVALDSFGGAVPLTSLPFPNSFSSQNSGFAFQIDGLTNNLGLQVGKLQTNVQRQLNVVDSLSLQRGSHSLKFGVDYRHLLPVIDFQAYNQQAQFSDVFSAESGSLSFGFVAASTRTKLLLRNLGVFAQDTWRIVPRLTLTYGLRWDVEFPPSSVSGPGLPAVTGYNLSDLSLLALAPAGTLPFHAQYGNVAPRIGFAYQSSEKQDWATVVRAGFGVFFDLVSEQVGFATAENTYPFTARKPVPGPATFPLDAVTAAPPAITAESVANNCCLDAFDPNLKSPYSLEWNVAVEQALGSQQTLSASYVGSSGRRLTQSADISSPSQNIAEAILVGNTGGSDYNALQVQFRRRLLHGLQVLTSYTWSHSIDTASAGSLLNASNAPNSFAGAANANRGASDFDIRNTFSAGITYHIPFPKTNSFVNSILRGWSIQNVIQARSAAPVSVDGFIFGDVIVPPSLGGFFTFLRPNIVPGQPFYLAGSQYPGGKALNSAAFTAPPTDPNTGEFLQGNLGRNALRGFGATQWDFSVHRDFQIREPLALQFRAELFNFLNHPNFGPPNGLLVGDPSFGVSTQMLGQSLSGPGSAGAGGFSPLYQIGGPRSVQFALKLSF